MKKAVLSVLTVLFMASLLGAAALADDENESVSRADAQKALAKAKTTLVEAIGIALKKFPEGKVVEVGLFIDDDEILYDVEMVLPGKHMVVEINALNGKIVDTDEEKPEAEQADEEKNEEAIAKAPMTLLQAVEAAVKKAPGKPFGAGAEKEKDKLVFEVDILTADKIVSVHVDPTTGEIVGTREHKE